MTSSSDPHASVKEMLRRIRFNIFERLEQGNFNYKRDMGTLRQHLQLAEEIDDPLTISAMHNAVGLVDASVGNMQSAEAHFQRGYELVCELGDERFMGTFQNNLGEIFRRAGKFQQAIDAYQQAHAHYERAEYLAGLMSVSNNLGLTYLAVGDYAQAEYHFQHVLNSTAEAPWDFLKTIIETRTGIAEIHCHAERYDQGWRQVNEAERLAQGGSFNVLLAQTYLTKAHLATRDPRHPQDQHHYYRLAREGLQQHGSPSILAHTLVEEARYQQRHHNLVDASRLAREAYDLFQSLDMAEDAALVSEMLSAMEPAAD